MSRARAEINLAAIAENLKLIKSKTSAQVLAVVKADAYGHGLINVAKEAEKAGADWLGTALVEEGIALRNGGITKPIISWLTPLGEDFKTAINLDIDLSISSIELLNEIISVGKSINKVPRVHIEIDTGMNRGGFGDDWGLLLPEIVKAVKANEVKAIGIWSHFARADEPTEVMNKTQLDVFTQKVKQINDADIKFELVHIANSEIGRAHV